MMLVVVRLGDDMSRDAHEIIEYLRHAISKYDEEAGGVVITEMAASNIIAELQGLMTDLTQL